MKAPRHTAKIKRALLTYQPKVSENHLSTTKGELPGPIKNIFICLWSTFCTKAFKVKAMAANPKKVKQAVL